MELSLAPAARPAVRHLSSADLDWALARGWEDFQEKRGDLLLLPIVYAVVGVLASLFAFRSALFPLAFPLAAGFALIGPVAAAGFYELARRREAGLENSWWHFLDPLTGPARLPLLALTLMLAAIFIAWIASAQAIYNLTLGTLRPADPAAFFMGLFGTGEGAAMIVLGNLAGALFAVLSLAVAAFSFPMVVDRPAETEPVTAVITSLAVFRRNPVTVLAWGARVAGILLLAALPLFVGLMVAMPVLGYATWHLYTRAVAR
ncbi:hypothetical protein IP88_04265 [alpha proteobacterium AAP81b]|nr:hypothetical protein IP88_04265 [alpha proteobacterium AAP81b]